MLSEAVRPRGIGRLEDPMLERAVRLAQSELFEDLAGGNGVQRRGQEIEIGHGPLPRLVQALAAQRRALERLHRDPLTLEALANPGEQFKSPQLTLRNVRTLLAKKIRPP